MDAAMILSAIQGPDKMDATAINRAYSDPAGKLGLDVKDKVVGIPAEYFGAEIDAEIKGLVMKAVKRFEDAGAKVKEISLPSARHALSAYYAVSSAEASSNLAKFDGVRFGHRALQYGDVDELIKNSRTEGFGWEVKRRIMLGTNILSAEYYESYYKRAALMRERIRAELDTVLAECSCLVTPTAATTAPRLGEFAGDPSKRYAAEFCTAAFSLAGLPAISLPCGTASDGLPAAVQIIGKRFDEQTVLQMAYFHEQAAGIEPIVADAFKGGDKNGRG